VLFLNSFIYSGAFIVHQYKNIDSNFFKTSPFSFVSQIKLNCTPEQLFDIFEDEHAWTVWVPAIKNVEWTSPKPFGVGTTRTVTLAGKMIVNEEFIAWKPGEQMTFKFTTGSTGSLRAFGEDYRVTDLGNNRCLLCWTMAMQPVGVSKLFMTVFKPTMGWYLNKLLKNLQVYVQKNVSPVTAS
jgi:L,D-peptidoglycan transpeptidase YkuD (ErfK/YbiS/YcfS/YnhG family)